MFHVLESQQFSREMLYELFQRADKLRDKPRKCLRNKILAMLFYEPSTRTRWSFESAMYRLGGQVITTENAKEFSSAVKGESLEDSIRNVHSYVDCIVLRHDTEGSATRAADVSKVPIINGGDGKGQHPTQALLDVYTIHREFNRLDNLKIAMVGDLANGRTVRSLCYLLGKFNGSNEIVFTAPKNVRMKDDIKLYLDRKAVRYSEEKNLDKLLPSMDVIYMTRIQKERMSRKDYKKAKGRYTINKDNFDLIRKDARIMHPLPHLKEIVLPIGLEETDLRVAYFRQAENGLYIRMALLDKVINNHW